MHSRLKRIIQELAETNGDLIETKIADTIIKNSAQNNPELNLQAEKLIEMLKKKSLSSEKGSILLMSLD